MKVIERIAENYRRPLRVTDTRDGKEYCYLPTPQQPTTQVFLYDNGLVGVVSAGASVTYIPKESARIECGPDNDGNLSWIVRILLFRKSSLRVVHPS